MTDINVKVDIPGAKEIGSAVEKITDKSINGVGQFLGSICLPVAGEIGAMLAERFSYYRQANLISYAAKLERKLGQREEGGLHAHPRLLYFATEQASLTDDDGVQELWAGLLSASCDESGKSQRNMIYMDMLSKITPDQARIVNFIFERSTPVITKKGVELSGIKLSLVDLIEQSGVHEVEFANEAISHLLSIDLITAIGDSAGGEVAWTLRGLGVAFCVRCQGFVGDPDSYFVDVPSISELRKQGKALFFSHNPVVSEDPR